MQTAPLTKKEKTFLASFIVACFVGVSFLIGPHVKISIELIKEIKKREQMIKQQTQSSSIKMLKLAVVRDARKQYQ